jgi:hypothetical protein
MRNIMNVSKTKSFRSTGGIWTNGRGTGGEGIIGANAKHRTSNIYEIINI